MGSHRHIGREDLEAFLAALDTDADAAAAKYAQLRERLVRYFLLRGIQDAERAAEETFDRIALKITGGTEVVNITRYSYGIARFVLFERLRIEQLEAEAAQNFQETRMKGDSGDDPNLLALFECLSSLAADDRELVVEYFVKDRGRTSDREDLARRFGLGMNALRLRVYRLKKRLAECVRGKQ